MASSQRLASQKNREPRLAVRAVKGTLFSTGGGGGGRENTSHLRHCPSGGGEKHWSTFKFLSGDCNENWSCVLSVCCTDRGKKTLLNPQEVFNWVRAVYLK